MNQLQLSILTLCNHIADVRGWYITSIIDGGTLTINFTCVDNIQDDCQLIINRTESELELSILFSNLLDLLNCNTIKLHNGSLNCEKLNHD